MKTRIMTFAFIMFSSLAIANEQECADTMPALDMASSELEAINEQLVKASSPKPQLDELRIKQKNWETIHAALLDRLFAKCSNVRQLLLYELGKNMILRHNFRGIDNGDDNHSPGSVMDYNPTD